MIKKITLTLGLSSLAPVALSYDFSRADQMFAARGNARNDSQRFDDATAARKEYDKVLTTARGLTSDEKVYAAVQTARLDIYRGTMLDIDKSKRSTALEECLTTIDNLESTKRQEFYYYKLACVASRAKLASTLGRLAWAMKMSNLQGAAIASTTVDGEIVGGFEGGGILRVLAAVRGNRGARAISSLKLYNPAEGLNYAERALASEAGIYPPYPEALDGEDYHENVYYKAQSQASLSVELADNEAEYVKSTRELFGASAEKWIRNPKSLAEESLENLVDGIQTLQDLEQAGSLPKGRTPELAFYKASMITLKGQVETCLKKGAGWKDCLKELGD